jgi:AraC-like DNA-binding protein
LHELRAAAPLPMFTPLPQNSAARCAMQRFSAPAGYPQYAATVGARLNKSVRTFNRLFRQQTGMAFRDWRQQACLMYALTALREGRTITEVALSLGYEYPAAFTSMFRKTMGYSPTAFVRQMNGGRHTPARPISGLPHRALQPVQQAFHGELRRGRAVG